MSVYSLNWTVGSPAHSTHCPSNRLVQTSLALSRSQMSAMPKIMFNCGFGVSDGDGVVMVMVTILPVPPGLLNSLFFSSWQQC